MRALAALAALAVALPLSSSAGADEAPTKRSEGKYFLDLAEVILTTKQFDMAVAHVQPTNARAGEPEENVDAKLSYWQKSAPRMTMGLNRTGKNGAYPKTSIEFGVEDFMLKDASAPRNFDGRDTIVTSPLIPPGIVFQRQQPEPPLGTQGDDFVPNYGNAYAFVRRVDFRSGGVTFLHNIKEGTQYRLRWLGGLRYAEIDHGVKEAVSFMPEYVENQQTNQDFFDIDTKVNTHGFGPNLGLDGRFILDKKKKKWSVQARGQVAMIPENTTASYGINFFDTSGESRVLVLPGGIIRFLIPESPIIPGIGSPGLAGDTFNAPSSQSDFTAATWLVEGRVGLHFQASRFFEVGVEAWQMTWSNLLSDAGVIDTVNRHATYEQFSGANAGGDPQILDSESVLHIPRYTKRDSYGFEGIAVNMKFDF
jgi:hypothetical protein